MHLSQQPAEAERVHLTVIFQDQQDLAEPEIQNWSSASVNWLDEIFQIRSDLFVDNLNLSVKSHYQVCLFQATL